MGEPADHRLLAYARELEQRDAALAAASGEVEELRVEAGKMRERAREIQLLLARLPAERRAANESVVDAERALALRLDEARDAGAALARAEGSADDRAVAAARRAAVRARDAATTAGARLERARAARGQLESEAERAGAEVPQLEARARQLALRLGALARVSAHAADPPVPGLAGTLDWAAKADAALFVVRSGLEAERERVVREANELGTSALNEPFAATSAAQVRERLERG